jgi:Tol biopolymer transport system component
VHPGARLGNFEVLSSLGSGGMGEVYRARDTTLGRNVALKLLPAAFASDADRLARFEREARTLAALNHPHIAQVYGVEQSAGVRALVMELVEGEDLAERLAAGPVPVDEALAIARQIAEALEAAHEAGIVHRDLKPANIKLRADGTVKVLDFGLAKASSVAAAGAGSADTIDAPTITSPAVTAQGTILGTAAYMSPEQARGRPVDQRTDIWAFGCVLWECLTGERLFGGDTASDALAAVLTRPLDLAKVPAAVPAAVRELLRRCLERDPHHRLHHIADARIVLQEVLSGGGTPAPAVPPAARRRVPLAALVAGAGALVAALLVVWAAGPWSTWANHYAPPLTARRAVIPLTNPGDFRSSAAALFALSDDGTTLLYGTVGGRTQGLIQVRRLGALESIGIPGTGGAQAVFLSPDGRMLGFERDADLVVGPVTGGAMTRLQGVSFLPEGRPAWTPDGRIVYTSPGGALMRVRPDGSAPERLTEPRQGERHLSPLVLPDGRSVLYTALGGDVNQARIEALRLEAGAGGTPVTVAAGGVMTPQYADGYLFYGRTDRTLAAVAFDPERLELRGDPVPFPDRLSRTRFGVSNFAAARGVLVYVPAVGARLIELDRSGRREPLFADDRAWHHPRYSPDGTRIVLDLVNDDDGERDVWVIDRASRTLSRVTSLGDAHDPSWLPDGRSVSFLSFGSARGPLLIAAADGGGDPRPVAVRGGFEPADLVNPGAWTPDGSAYVAGVREKDRLSDLWRVARDGTAERLVGSPYDEMSPAVSADGRWLSYTSNETGRTEVYVKRLDRPERIQISSSGGTAPVWDRRGVLYYVEAAGAIRRLIAVTLKESGLPAIGDRQVIAADLGLEESDNHPNYDVDPTGSRFVLAEARSSPGLVAVFDWATEVRRR